MALIFLHGTLASVRARGGGGYTAVARTLPPHKVWGRGACRHAGTCEPSTARTAAGEICTCTFDGLYFGHNYHVSKTEVQVTSSLYM